MFHCKWPNLRPYVSDDEHLIITLYVSILTNWGDRPEIFEDHRSSTFNIFFGPQLNFEILILKQFAFKTLFVLMEYLFLSKVYHKYNPFVLRCSCQNTLQGEEDKHSLKQN